MFSTLCPMTILVSSSHSVLSPIHPSIGVDVHSSEPYSQLRIDHNHSLNNPSKRNEMPCLSSHSLYFRLFHGSGQRHSYEHSKYDRSHRPPRVTCCEGRTARVKRLNQPHGPALRPRQVFLLVFTVDLTQGQAGIRRSTNSHGR